MMLNSAMKRKIFKTGQKDSPFRLKFETTRRKNALDTFASREYLRDETMPTHKHSIGLQYAKIAEDQSYRKLDIECALPIGKDSVAFGKVDAFYTKRFYPVEDKLKLVWLIQGGFVRPMFGMGRVAINDRFFIASPMGYQSMGNSFKSNVPKDSIEEVLGQQEQKQEDGEDDEEQKETRGRERPKRERDLMGDDLGSLNYLQTQLRLEFMDIPLIRNINLRTFTYLELACYPHLNTKLTPQSLMQSSRISLGYGFLLYYNACNWGTQKGADHERRGYINVNFGFF
ncbi:hypothetical protein FGO68_gene16447 [Halteria grandinella]|uniref:Uncharacterized protein n=1 Tax=Halteria grandinella TaxID=5974 RepID=A0A8J8T3Q8_HALGN|nr:hypothetical protein FGO68_gene16447 [Halteria grandinella]